MRKENIPNENTFDRLSKTLALMGGAWIAVELIKLFAKVVYTCPHCSNEIKKDINKCNHCGVGLIWKI
ncbi:MAG: hypothetical protein ABH886_01040 [Candidatus Desantisbacteria bacterium]